MGLNRGPYDRVCNLLFRHLSDVQRLLVRDVELNPHLVDHVLHGYLCEWRTCPFLSFAGLEFYRAAARHHPLKQQQAEIAAHIDQQQTGDDAFRTTLEALISVASRADDPFERSKVEQKRKLLSLVFSNLRLNGKKLDYILAFTLRPDDQLAKSCNLAGVLE